MSPFQARTRNVSTLKQGQELFCTFTLIPHIAPAFPGQCKYQVKVDSADLVKESNEGNNCKEIVVTVMQQ